MPQKSAFRPVPESAFTLIEMSIVLVIIGLIVGGILTGQELIHQAVIRRTISELQKYNTAVRTFQSKYGCLPGDCTNATGFFGTDASCPNGSLTPTGACNGSGTGILSTNPYGVLPYEDYYAMNQLGLSGLIAGSWPTGPGSGGCCHSIAIGTTNPASAYAAYVGYQMFTVAFSFNMPAADINKLVLLAGAVNTTWPDFLLGAGINAPDAYAMDNKIDDGLPGTGGLESENAPYAGQGNNNTTCLSGTSYSTALATGCSVFYSIE